MEDYRFFGLVHSKMSPHLAAGESLLWRRRLLTALMGTPEIAGDNEKLMLADETVGAIGARRCRGTDLKDNTASSTNSWTCSTCNRSRETWNLYRVR